MQLNKYQERAMSTRLESASEAYALLGLIGELGEVYSLIAKGVRDGSVIDEDKIKAELGDVLWFVAAIAADMEFTLENIAQYNLNKLESRQQRNTLQGSGDDR